MHRTPPGTPSISQDGTRGDQIRNPQLNVPPLDVLRPKLLPLDELPLKLLPLDMLPLDLLLLDVLSLNVLPLDVFPCQRTQKRPSFAWSRDTSPSTPSLHYSTRSSPLGILIQAGEITIGPHTMDANWIMPFLYKENVVMDMRWWVKNASLLETCTNAGDRGRKRGGV
ncbi:uncharacterized protein BDZ99DRAFT_514172 [Mytilinidion resinicola]|uniref:Uncharacterized protein n=1 Tax=Mytilinidion resinicola TaxID=574789 RepID=A0A6A6ZA04_9PEZI|nr:uncharacterized protein BDZ99DRAFT_514172 [Mytilinidion resinicola]KAF2817951.1 hypothetical protein BDZ99DRAFT_514172 [Mytilinidion resinicola]